MVNRQGTPASTRDRLLFSSCRIFADKGYRDTTVADICDTAQANIASVNYHFGNKESLYRQVWLRLIDLYEAPLLAELSPGPDLAERQLYAHVVERLKWLVEDDPLERLLRSEFVQPTGLVDDLRTIGVAKTQEHFFDAVRDVCAGALDEATMRLCVTSILSQCRALMSLSKLGYYPLAGGHPSDAEIQTFAHHVTGFSIAGIKALMESETSSYTVASQGAQANEPRPRYS